MNKGERKKILSCIENDVRRRRRRIKKPPITKPSKSKIKSHNKSKSRSPKSKTSSKLKGMQNILNSSHWTTLNTASSLDRNLINHNQHHHESNKKKNKGTKRPKKKEKLIHHLFNTNSNTDTC